MKRSATVATRQPLERTSTQLSLQAIQMLESWPGLNRSEALRLTLDRYYYLEHLFAPRAESLVEKYRPVFHVALADLSFEDCKVAAPFISAIVMGGVGEGNAPGGRERAT